MQPIQIAISNWPNSNVSDSIVITIAIFALLVSLYSAYLSRAEHKLSSRPYVWAANYAVQDEQHTRLIPQNDKIRLKVFNAPAKINELCVCFKIDGVKAFSHRESDFVRFPDETSEWSFVVGINDINDIILQSAHKELQRCVFISYTAINHRQVFEYTLIQHFNALDGQWRSIKETSS